jgi:hypothetical protein
MTVCVRSTISPIEGGVRGKYHRQAAAGANLVLIEAELAETSRDAESVNRALWLLRDAAEAVAGPTCQCRRRRRPGPMSRRAAYL